MEKSRNETGGQPRPFVLELPDKSGHVAILDRLRSVSMRSGFVVLKPGQDVGAHSTGSHEELIIILGGRGAVEAEGLGRVDVGGSRVIYIPPDTMHNVFNTGDEPLRYIYVVAPVTAGASGQ